jgi:phosphoribosylformimino-5-aminoimidazole carboxamide ribotide isomerase
MKPMQAMERLGSAGWHEVILLDLARVGTGAGIDWPLVSGIRRAFPEIALTIGGGIQRMGELIALEAAGVSAALVATALHDGSITREQLAVLDLSAG